MKIEKLTLSLAITIMVGVFAISSCGSSSSEEKPEKEEVVEAEPSVYELKIVATGEKNELAKSSEVWILDLNSDVEQVDNLFSSAMIDSNWVKSGEKVVATQWPASIRYNVNVIDSLNLRLYRHTWSGNAEVYINNKLVEKLDLYSTDSVTNYIDIFMNPSDY